MSDTALRAAQRAYRADPCTESLERLRAAERRAGEPGTALVSGWDQDAWRLRQNYARYVGWLRSINPPLYTFPADNTVSFDPDAGRFLGFAVQRAENITGPISFGDYAEGWIDPEREAAQF